MDYQSLLKRSFNLVKANRFMWLLGLLAGGGGYNGYSYATNYRESNQNWQNIENLKNNIENGNADTVQASVKSVGQILGDSAKLDISNTALIAASVVALLLLILAIYLSITAKGAIVRSANKLDKDEKVTLGQAWREGHRYFWRRLSFGLIMFAISIIVLFVTIMPVALLGIFNLVTPAVILGILLGITLIATLIYIALISPYAERTLLLENKRTIPALKSAAKLFNKNWRKLVLLFLVLIAVSFFYAIALGAVMIFALVILCIIGAILYFIAHTLALVYACLAIIALLILLLAVSGFFQAFTSTAVTLAYLEVKE